VTGAPSLSPTGGRAASRERTRRRLLEVGRKAFARRGHAATNLKDDILAPAGVSVGSFYHQFKDKTDLFLAILEEHGETFRNMIHEAHRPREGVPGEALARHSFETVFRVAEENADLFRIMLRERESEDVRVRRSLREGRRRWTQGLVEDYRALLAPRAVPDADLELAAELVQSMTFGVVVQFLELDRDERSRQRERLIDGLVRFSLGGLAALLEAAATRRPATGKD
jgi:AcrR family transcriptional regulator